MDLLQLPEPALLAVFGHLSKRLADAVALSSTCKALRELGADSCCRRFACAACGHPIFDPAAALCDSHRSDTPCLALQDGEALAIDAQHAKGCRLMRETGSAEWHLRWTLAVKAGLMVAVEDYPEYSIRAQHAHCGNPKCGLYLGRRLCQLGALRAGAAARDVADWRAAAALGRVYLVARYLRVQRADGSEDYLLQARILGRGASSGRCTGPSPQQRSQLSYYCCTGARSPLCNPGECGAVLCDTRAVLSRAHRWDAGQGAERAFYVNSLLSPDCVALRNERVETLCQGEMKVADVYCARCAARIGWKFLQDLEKGQENSNQVGRYGLVKSSLEQRSAEVLGLV